MRQQIEPIISSKASSTLPRLWRSIYALLTADIWAIFCILGTLISFLSLGKNYFTEKKENKYILLGIAGVGLSLLFLTLSFSAKYQQENSGRAVLVNKRAGLRNSPNLQNPESKILQEGMPMYILEKKYNWTKIQLDNGFIGWLPSSMLEKV